VNAESLQQMLYFRQVTRNLLGLLPDILQSAGEETGVPIVVTCAARGAGPAETWRHVCCNTQPRAAESRGPGGAVAAQTSRSASGKAAVLW